MQRLAEQRFQVPRSGYLRHNCRESDICRCLQAGGFILGKESGDSVPRRNASVIFKQSVPSAPVSSSRSGRRDNFIFCWYHLALPVLRNVCCVFSAALPIKVEQGGREADHAAFLNGRIEGALRAKPPSLRRDSPSGCLHGKAGRNPISMAAAAVFLLQFVALLREGSAGHQAHRKTTFCGTG